MKKTLVALVIAATAASASAVNVYEKDGTSIDIEGSLRLFLGKEGKDKRGDLINDGSRLWVKANQEIGNGLSALAAVEMRFDEVPVGSDNTFGNPRANQLYAGFAHKDVGTVTFGRQDTTLDLVQLSDFVYRGGNNNLAAYANKSIKFVSAEWNGLTLGLDYLFGNAKKDSAAADLKYGYGASLFYTRDLAQDVTLNLAAGYSMEKQNDASAASTATGFKNDAWRTSAQLVFGKAALGVEFGRNYGRDNDGSIYNRGRTVLVGAKYDITEPSTVYFQYQNNQKQLVSTNAKETSNVYISGVDYKFNKNVVVFTEVARTLTKENTSPVTKSNDTAFGVGLRVFF